MEYKCKKQMCLEKVDGDGFSIPNEYGIVPVGSFWYEDKSSIIGGEVHLECASGADDMGWIEISRKDLEEFFEPIG